MSDLPLLDYIEQAAAWARAEAGGARAAEKAERLESGWKEAALEAVRLHALMHRAFRAEQVAIPFPDGASKKSSGPIMNEAARRGWIRTDGWEPADSSNGSAKRLWASLIYGGAECAT